MPKFGPGIIACRNIPVIYVPIPKSACTTIKNLLYQMATGTVFPDPLGIHRAIRHGHLTDTFVAPDEDLDPFVRSRSVSFTFVRDPLIRIYSCFNEKIYSDSPYSFPRLRDRYLPHVYGLTLKHPPGDYSAEQHSDNFRRFLLFVKDNVAGTSAVRQDGHWLPQTSLLRRVSERMVIDVIGRVESYKSEMSAVLDRLGMADRPELLEVKFNEGLQAPYRLEQILTDEIRDLAAGIYAQDYQELGYRLHQ